MFGELFDVRLNGSADFTICLGRRVDYSSDEDNNSLIEPTTTCLMNVVKTLDA